MSGDLGFYTALLDGISDGVCVVDRAGAVIYWSRGAERLTGYPAAEVVGRRCEDGVLHHIPEPGVESGGWRCPVQATVCDGRRRDDHLVLRHRRGHRQPVWLRAGPLPDPAGWVGGAVAVFSDDTAAGSASSNE